MPVTDYFAILGVPASSEIDRARLDAQYRSLQAQWHPDRFVTASEAERRQALQQASLINDAYQMLKQPLRRAEHLLELKDTDAAVHQARKLEPAFLLHQLEQREELERLGQRRDQAAFARLRRDTETELQLQWRDFAATVQQQDWCSARLSLQKLQFLHKLQEELDHLEDRWLDTLDN
ncbi:MAG TPA: Fe-S protein assembly co-chaperone HscB [Candidatus Acidoferrum sp.]|nr:Fe-S protein assembly co-chaperone HscB [Candidatus Acidoferrum sp.]